MEKIKTKTGMFFLGLVLQALLTALCFGAFGVADTTHAIAVVVTFLLLLAYVLYYWNKDRSLFGRDLISGFCGIVITAIATIIFFL